MPYTLEIDLQDDIATEVDESLDSIRVVYHPNQPKHGEEE